MSNESPFKLINSTGDMTDLRVEARVAGQPASVAELCAVIESVIKGEAPPKEFVPARPKLLKVS